MHRKIYINYRGARQIAWLMFQTLLRRPALAAVFSSAVWVRDKPCLSNVAKVLAHTQITDCCHSQFSKFPASSLFVFCAAINKSDFRQIAEVSPNLTWTVSGSLPRNITVLLRD